MPSVNIDFENKKVAKKVIRLIYAIRIANYNDLLLMCALASYRCIKLSPNFEEDIDSLMTIIRAHNYILGLLDK